MSGESPYISSRMSYIMVTFLKHAKTSEMALFHVCYFQGFWRLTMEVAQRVHRSMSYGLRKFGRRGEKVTWLRGPGKRHLRMANFRIRPWGEVTPDFTPRSHDFVFQLAFGVKRSHSKFGFKPLKPGGLRAKTLFFLCFGHFLSWCCFTCISFLRFTV